MHKWPLESITAIREPPDHIHKHTHFRSRCLKTGPNWSLIRVTQFPFPQLERSWNGILTMNVLSTNQREFYSAAFTRSVEDWKTLSISIMLHILVTFQMSVKVISTLNMIINNLLRPKEIELSNVLQKKAKIGENIYI